MASKLEMIVEMDGECWRADARAATSLAIRQTFGPHQPNAFDLPDATERPVDQPGFSGSIESGAACNCRRLELTPHANGTHTETIGHLTATELAPADCLPDGPMAAILISVEPVRFDDTDDTYRGKTSPDDAVITREMIASAVDGSPLSQRVLASDESELPLACVIRTPPLNIDRETHDWTGTNPPYPTTAAITWLADRGVSHLVTDLPSVDREDDGGRLPNHRAWWDIVDPGGPIATDEPARQRTITEMVRVPDDLTDGDYLLQIDVPSLQTDAVPSRPLLFPTERHAHPSST